MSQDLVSSVPGIFAGFYNLVKAAGAALNPPVPTFAFELNQYEPGSYLTVHEIVGPVYAWETIGAFSQYEDYDIGGMATIFTGESPVDNPSVQTTILQNTYTLFQETVMTVVMSNRAMPLLGTTGPSPLLMVPQKMEYAAGPGIIGGGPGGWCGQYHWSFHFKALLTPA